MEIADAYLILLVKGVTTLLPLVPAYILFRALPSQAEVSGPFKGLTMKLGGAFAGYFLIFLLLWRGLDVEVERYHYHTWTINGSVAMLPADTAPDFHEITSYMRPPDLRVQNDGSFHFEVPVREDVTGALEWPQLSMELNGYVPAVVHLYRPDQAPTYGVNVLKEQYDSKTRTIDLVDPVTFRPRSAQPPYEPAKSEQPMRLAER
jgi:hypothetical protein